MTDVIPFLRAFLNNPRRVGAIAPSGAALAEAITAEISPDSAPVIELGPGTGSFTQRLIERGVPEDRLTLIEYGPDFAHMLEQRFSQARVIRMDAARLKQVQLFDDEEKAGAVISGIPLLSMSPRQVFGILNGVFHHLRADGAFYQFTYGPRCPVPRAILDRLGLKAVRIGRALVNVPPATVYRISRHAQPTRGRATRPARQEPTQAA
jgi:phosphatidylethanolamine/phosphatidyl-N-methylethanolamine N-methyltransferase